MKNRCEEGTKVEKRYEGLSHSHLNTFFIPLRVGVKVNFSFLNFLYLHTLHTLSIYIL